MKRTDKLYGSLGELIYAVAKADGLIQDTEFTKLDELLEGHPWAETIKWSFDYEVNKNSDPEDVYEKVINNCQTYGPSTKYLEFIDIITQIAEASDGIDKKEDDIIKSFSHDLVERFRKDIRNIGTEGS